jgi:signal transduction histidine kinase/ActR/RegA family two-component response regulator
LESMNDHQNAKAHEVYASGGFENRTARGRDLEAEARAFEKLAAALAASPAEALQRILEASLELCRAHSAAIGLRGADTNSNVPRWEAFAGQLRYSNTAPPLGVPSSACASILNSRHVRHFSHPASEHPELGRLSHQIVEALAAPIESEGVAVGALWVFFHDTSRRFDPEDARALAQLAIRAAIAQRLRTHTRQAEHSRYLHERRLALLWQSAEVLLTAGDPDAMLHRLFDQIREDLEIDTYFNFMVAEGGESLSLASCAGITAQEAEKIGHLEFGQAICGAVARQRVSIVATHIQESSDPKVQLVRGYGIRAYACNPLMSQDRLLGTLSFASHTRDSFSVEDLDFFRIISRYVAVAYERLTLIDGLREADRRKDEFLAMLAHELRNPLAPIRASVEFLKRKAPNPGLRSAHGIIERQVGNMVRIVDDLLDVSRVTQGRIELQCAQVTLGMVLDQAIEAVRPALQEADHELRVNVAEDPIVLNADPARLTQVFANLLDNAVKYTPRGGRITVQALREGNQLCVTVEDNGAGIPKEMLPRVFDLFTQADRTLQRSRGGLGIGLTLVRKLVELHGGTVDGASAGENQGSRFRVRLPLATVPGAVAANSGLREQSASHSSCHERILIVDDNQDAADSLAVLLRGDGHSVHVVYDGTQALTSVRELRPSVVLLDIGMPGMDGYQVCRQIRRDPVAVTIKIVALTGYGQPADKERTQEAGFDAHLVKPVDLRALIELFAKFHAHPAPM